MGKETGKIVGLKDIHVALLVQDNAEGIQYDTPQKLARSIKAKITNKSSSSKEYSDDAVEDIIHNFDGLDIEIEVNKLTLAERALLQGATIDTSGKLIESKDDIPPTLALGFKSKTSTGKYRFVWCLKGQFSPASDEYETETEKPNSKTASLKGEFYARANDGQYRYMADETDETSALHDTWFTTETLGNTVVEVTEE